MNEITKDNLMSFILQIKSLRKSLQNDMYGTPIVKIKKFEKESNNAYKVNGIAIMDLSATGKEKTFFEVEATVSSNKITLNNTQISKIKLLCNPLHKNRDFDFTGEKLQTVDSFSVHKGDSEKYLVHLTEDDNATIYPVDNNYTLKDGFDETIESLPQRKINELESRIKNKEPRHKKSKLKSLIRRR